MKWFDELVKRTAEYQSMMASYEKALERRDLILQDMDQTKDHRMEVINELRRKVDSKDGEIEAIRKHYLNIPDAAKHMAVVAECERLKFVNAELEANIRTLEYKLVEAQCAAVQPVPGVDVHKVVVGKDHSAVRVVRKKAPAKKLTPASRGLLRKKAKK